MNKSFFLISICIFAQGSINAMEKPPLEDAVERGDIEQVKALLKAGRDANFKFYGQAAIHAAVMYDRQEIIQLLLDHSVDVDLQDNGGRTALSIAAQGGRKAIAQLLLSRGANVNHQDAYGMTPLHWAYQFCNISPDFILFLLDHGANVNLRDKWGGTFLHRAAQRYNPVVIQRLLELGAYTNLKAYPPLRNKEGLTPLNLAAEFSDKVPYDKGQLAIVELLRSWQKVVSVSDAERSAFCMAMHPRVGANSPASVLSQYEFQEICSYLRPQIDDPAATEYRQLCKQPRQQRQPQDVCTIC